MAQGRLDALRGELAALGARTSIEEIRGKIPGPVAPVSPGRRWWERLFGNQGEGSAAPSPSGPPPPA